MIERDPAAGDAEFDPLADLEQHKVGGRPRGAPIRVLVANADPELFRDVIALLRSQDELRFVGEAGTVTECLDRVTSQRPEVVLAALQLPDGNGIDLARMIEASAPETAFVLQLSGSETAETWHRILQAGVRDYFTPSTEPMRVLDQIREAAAAKASVTRGTAASQKRPAAVQPALTARLITFTTPCRGVGQTTLAVNTAICLAEIEPTVLIDLRMPLGDAAIFLDVMPDRTVVHFAQSFGGLDATVVKAVIEDTSFGIKLIAAPISPPGEEADLAPHDLDRLLYILAEDFRFIVIDAPPPSHPLSAFLIEKSERIFATARADLARLRTLRSLVNAPDLPASAIERLQPMIILGAEKRECRPRNIPELCGHADPLILPFDSLVATRAINLGRPVCARGQRSPLANTLRKYTRTWAGEPGKGKKRALGWRR